jgi:hypothetical protein
MDKNGDMVVVRTAMMNGGGGKVDNGGDGEQRSSQR